MRNPDHFPRILNLGMFLVSILYISVGVVGYLRYGAAICGSITLNLPYDKVWVDSLWLELVFKYSYKQSRWEKSRTGYKKDLHGP